MTILMMVIGWILTAVYVFLSLMLHEWAHVFAVRLMRAKVEKVGFFQFGMMAKVRGLENLHSWERYVIYAAGPLANIAVATWAFTVSRISYVGVGWLEDLAFYNLVLGLFNLTPALPLDGGRILWQFLGNRLGILRASRIVKSLAAGISHLFFFLGLIQIILNPINITLICAAAYIRHKNKDITLELQAAFYMALDGKNSTDRARTLPIKEIPVPADMEIKHALERLAGDYFIIFHIDGDENRPLRERTLLNHVFKYGINGTLGDIPQLIQYMLQCKE